MRAKSRRPFLCAKIIHRSKGNMSIESKATSL